MKKVFSLLAFLLSLKGLQAQQVIDVAARAAFGKLMEKGDATSQDMETIIAQLSKHS